jgi:hypothetical protein
VTRWIAKARDDILADVRRRLSERLKLRSGEFQSLMRLVRSEVAISLRTELAPRQP